MVAGESLALFAFLRDRGTECVLLDCFHRNAGSAPLLEHGGLRDARIVVVHLWTSDAYGERLLGIVRELVAAKNAYPQLEVIAHGPLARSASADLLSSGAIDSIVASAKATPEVFRRTVGSIERHAVESSLSEFLATFTSLTRVPPQLLPSGQDVVFSIRGSRGCRARCRFCAYNADVAGAWLARDIREVVEDISYVHNCTGTRHVALSDNDFGGTRDECRQRARQLREEMQRLDLAEHVSISLNVRSESVDSGILSDLRDAGVRAVLMGIESFSDDTRRVLFGKRLNMMHAREVASAADRLGITIIASYILWHPWQSMKSLRDELVSMAAFGRHRIPHFLTRSRLSVIPGTPIEAQLASEGLLTSGVFHRDFTFRELDVAEAFADLSSWFEINVSPVLRHASEDVPADLEQIARLKMREFAWFAEYLELGNR